MIIPKPLRFFLSSCLTSFSESYLFVFLFSRIGYWSIIVLVVTLPVAWIAWNILVDLIDDSLRTITRDRR